MSSELILLIGQLALRYGPALAAEFVNLYHRNDITAADLLVWLGRAGTYGQYIADAQARLTAQPASPATSPASSGVIAAITAIGQS